jgi:hypothetical protein
MTSAATFLPKKLVEPASNDLNVEVNFTSADKMTLSAPTMAIATIDAIRGGV